MDENDQAQRIRALEHRVGQLERALLEVARRSGFTLALPQQEVAQPVPMAACGGAIASGPSRATISAVTKLEPAVRVRRGPQL